MRHDLRAIMGCWALMMGCTGAEPTSPPRPHIPGPDPAPDEVVGEPIRLPFSGAVGNDELEYVFTTTLPLGCTVTYHRWRGLPDEPGPPIARIRVRSAHFAPLGGITPVFVTDAGEQHVFRRGPARDPYQANLTFTRCTDAQVDDVLERTEVTTMDSVGTELPAPADVCIGPIDALRRVHAVPSHSGVYRAGWPVYGEYINWRVEGLGCVTYHALSSVVPCEGTPLPWVAAVGCGR